MKVLFVSSGNSANFQIAPFIKSQGDSLLKLGIEINYYSLIGKGIIGYLKNIRILRKYASKQKLDIIHAHYTLSGWVAVLATRKIPVLVSYMGCDAYGNYNKDGSLIPSSIFLIIGGFLLQPFPTRIIVKSENLLNYIWLKKKASVIPNGVDLELFTPKDQKHPKIVLEKQEVKKKILFLGDTNDFRKNFKLATDSVSLLPLNVELIFPYPVPHNEINKCLNECDVLILTSYIEGSPNVVKEAMACNCPIVTTDVGDVKWILGETEGCYITTFDPTDVAEKLAMALNFGKRTNGRQRILELGLESKSVASRLIELYSEVLANKKLKNKSNY